MSNFVSLQQFLTLSLFCLILVEPFSVDWIVCSQKMLRTCEYKIVWIGSWSFMFAWVCVLDLVGGVLSFISLSILCATVTEN